MVAAAQGWQGLELVGDPALQADAEGTSRQAQILFLPVTIGTGGEKH
jgi:hypothetical protein